MALSAGTSCAKHFVFSETQLSVYLYATCQSIPRFDRMGYIIDSLRLSEDKEVYPPLDDSVILAKAVEVHAFGSVLDMGTGTGVQGIVAALKGCDVTFADISAKALEIAEKNAKANGVNGKFVKTNLFSKLKGRKFNTIIFNPPYLPSELGAEEILALHGGGKQGREVIDRFLSQYRNFIAKDHTVLLVESSLNNYPADAKRLKAQIVGKTHYFFEDIVVLKFL